MYVSTTDGEKHIVGAQQGMGSLFHSPSQTMGEIFAEAVAKSPNERACTQERAIGGKTPAMYNYNLNYLLLANFNLRYLRYHHSVLCSYYFCLLFHYWFPKRHRKYRDECNKCTAGHDDVI